jgi:DNA helicase-2/ATP-dependent DNA helicase PcrA
MHSDDRQLVLTHTHAGVDSLKKRFKLKNISSSKFAVETIHSFALKFAGSYPKTTGLSTEAPQDNREYNQVISSAVNPFIQEKLLPKGAV